MSTAGERRRWPRGTLDECYLRLVVEIPVTVRDVSAGGALVEAPVEIATGSAAQLHTVLCGQPFSPEVVVCRTADAEPGARRGPLAVKFGAMDENTRAVLTQFLKTAVEPANESGERLP